MPSKKDPDQYVKSAAFEYLVVHAPGSQHELFLKYLLDKDYQVRGAALVSFAVESRNKDE
jgi:hypothetical protein